MAERIIISGDPGTRWTNTTEKVQYQFIAALINTCGTCLQYHLKIGAWWPIPIHYGCRCRQEPINPKAEAPHKFIDYRELLANMPPAEQVAAVGASNYWLLKAGVVQWSDVVTPSRVRDLREVVAKKKLTVDQMTKAGVGPRWAREAHAAVQTPEHELVAQQRQQLLQRLVGAGISQEQLVGELSARLAERVSIGAGAGIEAQRLRRPGGGDHGGLLAALLNKPKPPKPKRPAPQKPEEPVTVIGPVTEKPGEAILPRPPEFKNHADVEKWAKEIFPSADVKVAEIAVESWQLIANEVHQVVKQYPGIAGRLKKFGAQEAHAETIAWAQAGSGEYLHFNPTHWNNLSGLDKALKDGVASEYHPLGVEHAGPQYYVTHEMGHLLDGYLKTAEPAKWRDLMGSFYDPARPSTFYEKEWQLRARYVSDYAATMPTEAFAETFAAARWRKEPGNTIVDKFKDILKP